MPEIEILLGVSLASRMLSTAWMVVSVEKPNIHLIAGQPTRPKRRSSAFRQHKQQQTASLLRNHLERYFWTFYDTSKSHLWPSTLVSRLFSSFDGQAIAIKPICTIKLVARPLATAVLLRTAP